MQNGTAVAHPQADRNFPDYPFAGQHLELNGNRLHYLDEGPRDGDPVVMVHGNPTWSFYYRHLVRELNDRYRTVVPDHIGMGLSDTPSADEYSYTLSQRVDDLEALLSHLGLEENLTLVLHDWGGMIGMAYATRHPDRVKRFVIFNTAAFHLPKSKPFPWQLKLCRRPWLGPVMVQGFNAFCRGAVRNCVTRRPMPQAVKDAYLAPYDSWEHRQAVLQFVKDIPLKQADPGYDEISRVEANLHQFRDRPMFIGWGMKDFVFDEHFLREWTLHFPAAEVHRYDDAGHYVLEDTAEELVPLVRQFLDNHPLPAAQ